MNLFPCFVHAAAIRLAAAGVCVIGGLASYSYAEIAVPAATPIPGDINSDGVVNIQDLQLLTAAWGSQKGPPSTNWSDSADLDGDGIVNISDLQVLVTNWGASAGVSIQKNPLGGSTTFSGPMVGKVYVPSRYGGQLTLSGADVQLFYTDGSDLQQAVADQIHQGALDILRVAQGNPCSYTVPVGKPGWYYIRLPGTAPVTITSTFEENGQTSYRPWNGWWWPQNQSEGPTLYDIGGPLSKYDLVYGTAARAWERTYDSGGGYWFGHCWGWSIASILMPIPQATTKNGVSFTALDMQGLYTELADTDPYLDTTLTIFYIPITIPTALVGQDIDRYCDDVYRILRMCIREDGVPIQSDMRAIATPPALDGEIWNHAIYKYTSTWIEVPGRNNERLVQIDMVVYSNFGPWTPPSPDIQDRVDRYVYQLEFDSLGQVNPAAPTQNWISVSYYPPRDLFRLTGTPWTSQNPYVTKSQVDALYQP